MDDLQFERAEFGAGAGAMACTGCHQPIAGDYYDVNGQPFCPACTAAHPAGARRQPGGAAFARALGAGLGAGAVGSALYYIVERISGYQLVDHRHRRRLPGRARACAGAPAAAAACSIRCWPSR